MGVVHLRGEGGSVWQFDEPLPRAAADQLRKGQLVEVPAPDEPAPSRAMTVAAAEPARSDAKSAWVDYAVAHGARVGDAEAATKAELIDQYSN